MKRIITAEQIGEGHPDKLCDLIADSILDACLMQDSSSRVACEVLASNGEIKVAGEITTAGEVDYENVVIETLRRVGYNPSDYFIDICIHEQSVDISNKVNVSDDMIGAGDQGVVYGYATNETNQYLPLPCILASAIERRLDYCRRLNIINGLGPDSKCQVSVEYDGDIPIRIDSVIVSTQHSADVDLTFLRSEIKKHVLNDVFKYCSLDKDTKVMINPGGNFIIGGPEGDTGLTGRKLMCDTYGGIAHHGGGAFSGKDATKVDRTGAYYARYIAKNIVAANLAKKCEVSLSFVIGEPKAVAVSIDTFGTSRYSDELIKEVVETCFNLDVKYMIEKLQLRQPIFRLTTCYGHFKEGLAWEDTDMIPVLQIATLRKEAKYNG